jgi:hypothetical protein
LSLVAKYLEHGCCGMADMQALNRGSEKFLLGRFSQMVMDLPILLPPCKENGLKSRVQDGGERNTDLTAS